MRRNEKEVSELQEIEEIINKSETCRIAFADNNIPYIVALNFGYSGDSGQRLFFHCAKEGRKLNLIKKNNYVCFQMDIERRLYKGTLGCDWGMKYRSVLGYGFISVVTEDEARKSGLNCIMAHYGESREYTFDDNVFERTTVLCLEIKEMTGKKC